MFGSEEENYTRVAGIPSRVSLRRGGDGIMLTERENFTVIFSQHGDTCALVIYTVSTVQEGNLYEYYADETLCVYVCCFSIESAVD